jgi:cyanophycinase-like exopeptidase
MRSTTLIVGSIPALGEVLALGELLPLRADADVVLLPTAAAFIGMTEVAVALSNVFEDHDVRVEALMVADRAAAHEPYFAARLRAADLVVLADGSALHARGVWHETPVGEALRDAHTLVAIGACASVLGDVMIDPRGGAPTLGLGYRSGLVIGVDASEEQLTRTRSLLSSADTLAILGPAGVLFFDGTWRRVSDDVVVTRAGKPVEL